MIVCTGTPGVKFLHYRSQFKAMRTESFFSSGAFRLQIQNRKVRLTDFTLEVQCEEMDGLKMLTTWRCALPHS